MLVLHVNCQDVRCLTLTLGAFPSISMFSSFTILCWQMMLWMWLHILIVGLSIYVSLWYCPRVFPERWYYFLRNATYWYGWRLHSSGGAGLSKGSELVMSNLWPLHLCPQAIVKKIIIINTPGKTWGVYKGTTRACQNWNPNIWITPRWWAAAEVLIRLLKFLEKTLARLKKKKGILQCSTPTVWRTRFNMGSVPNCALPLCTFLFIFYYFFDCGFYYFLIVDCKKTLMHD